MKILAINNGHNSTAGIFEDGECVCIFHEEKFNNIKNSGGLPLKALNHINKEYGIKDVDLCVFSYTEQVAWDTEVASIENIYQGGLKNLYNYLEYKTGLKNLFWAFRSFIFKFYLVPKGTKQVRDIMTKKFKIPAEKIIFTDHHTNHCLSPLYFYGLQDKKQDLLLISLDGVGDGYCAKVFKYLHKKKKLKLFQEIRYEESPGMLYREFTAALGFKRMEHEHKVMGLAAYVTDDKYYNEIYEQLKEIIWFDKKSLSFKAKFNTNVSLYYFQDLVKGKRFDNLAAALQKITEELVLEWIKALIKKTKIKNIAMSGGVFMNVKLNQKIVELKEVQKAYFQPSCGDDSLIVGAAAQEFIKRDIPLKPINTMFLGHDYSKKEVEDFLIKHKVRQRYEVKYFDDIEKETARLLAEHKIVPRFKGKGEWGARSLCNRAIIGNASDLRTFYTVNDQIKMRDFWMPFAPTILDTWAGKYIENWSMYKKKAWESTKYMILTYNTTALAREHLRAGIHQKDFTMRPQIVSKSDSPDLYKLLKYYEKYTGMGGFLNTSLNVHGYPLVGTLEQALFTSENSGLEYISIENYLLRKKKNKIKF